MFDRFRALLSERRLRRRMRQAPLVPLSNAPEGTLIRVVGGVRPLAGRVLEAPLSGRLCVYYAVEVLASAAASPPEDPLPVLGANVIASEQDGVAFVLDDGHARAVIDPAHATIAAAFDHVSTSAAAFDASLLQREFLVRHDLIRRDWWNTTSVIYREAVIELDGWIAVVGTGTCEADPGAPPTGLYRDGAAQRLRLTGTARFPLMITDDVEAP